MGQVFNGQARSIRYHGAETVRVMFMRKTEVITMDDSIRNLQVAVQADMERNVRQRVSLEVIIEHLPELVKKQKETNRLLSQFLTQQPS